MEEYRKLVGLVSCSHFKGDIIITDPCYLDDGMDEQKDSEGNWISWYQRVTPENIPSLMSTRTLYGDWGCSVYDVTHEDVKPEKIGEFCADAGMVCVCLLEDVLKFNPKFEKFLEKCKHCYTIIKNFDGNVLFNKYEDHFEYEGKECVDYSIKVEGGGKKDGQNFAFISSQTSL